jgi:glycosyltransferase involved in cell wall biosynthesis
MVMSISVIVPTKGRPTLVNTLLSIIPQLRKDDEIIVAADGLLNLDEVIALDSRIQYFEMHASHDSGNTQRDRAIQRARGSHLAFVDDDDVMAEGAMEEFHRASKVDANCIWIFRMEYGEGSSTPGLVLWQDPVVRPSNIGTPMWLIPNRPDLPNWRTDTDLAYSDYLFLTNTIKTCYTSSDDVRWDKAIVSIIRPKTPDGIKI